jgi:hypothetical protein
MDVVMGRKVVRIGKNMQGRAETLKLIYWQIYGGWLSCNYKAIYREALSSQLNRVFLSF